MGDGRYQVTLLTGPSVLQAPGDGFLWVVPASRVAMDTSSLLIAFGPLLTFKAPAPSSSLAMSLNVAKYHLGKVKLERAG